MSRVKDAELFTSLMQGATTLHEISRHVEDLGRELGFRHFGFGHHFDANVAPANVFFLHNYPSAWADQFIERKMYLTDPVVRAGNEFTMPYHWESVPRIIQLSSKDREHFRAAQKAGVENGYSVPLTSRGEIGASFNFATPTRQRMKEVDFFYSSMVGRLAFEACRQLIVNDSGSPKTERVELTPRQRDCLILAAQGKTDWEIGRILGISEETASLHLKTARERYGVTKRMSLAIRALYDGHISFAEVIQ